VPNLAAFSSDGLLVIMNYVFPPIPMEYGMNGLPNIALTKWLLIAIFHSSQFMVSLVF